MSESTRSAGLAHRSGRLEDAPAIADYYHRCWLDVNAAAIEAQAEVGMDASMWLGFFGDRLSPVDNERALALYASAGWQLTDQLIHGADHGIEYDEHVLVKHLVDGERDDVSRSSPS